MPTPDVFPLFAEIALSADDVRAIAAALYQVAGSDGTHAEEIEMLQGLLQSLNDDLGEVLPTTPEAITPTELAARIVDPVVRKVVLQCLALLSIADGKVTELERQAALGFVAALGFSSEDYGQVEASMQAWVTSGDVSKLF